MNKENMEKLALLEKKEAEDVAVKQFTDMYNKVDQKELDITKLELVLRNVFAAGAWWKEAVMTKEFEAYKKYEDGVREMRDAAIDFDGDDDFFDKVWDKAGELMTGVNS